MKSLKVLLASAAIFAACASASAQYVVGAPNVFASYSPTTFVMKGDGGSITESFHSVAAGISSSMDIPSLPFAFEYGAELQYSWRNDDGYKMNFLGVKAPANILYNFEFPSAPVSFVPLVGIDLGVYVLGKEDDEDIFTEFMGEKLSRFILDWHIGAKICYDKFFFSATYESPITCMYNKDGVKIFNKFTNLSLGIRF